jgi:hypothetical protein
MPNVVGGYQPDTKSSSARRADFELLRRIARGDVATTDLTTSVTNLNTEVGALAVTVDDLATEVGNLATEVDDLTAEVAALAAIPGWTALSLQSPWLNYGGVYHPAQYRIDRGVVELRGMVKPSTNVAALSIIASGLPTPPPGSLLFPALCYLGSGNAVAGRVDINNTGGLGVSCGATFTITTSGWLSLNGIRWTP